MDATMSELGDYLQREIEGRGWSWREASRQVGMNYSTLRNVLVGTGVPELPTLQKIASALGLSLARLQNWPGFVRMKRRAAKLSCAVLPMSSAPFCAASVLSGRAN